KELQLINTMYEKQVDGILFMGGNIHQDHVDNFSSSSVPVVIAATYDETNTIPSVNIDYKKAAYEVTQYLIDNGHEHPAFVYGQADIKKRNALKYEGYKEAMDATDVDFIEDYVVNTGYSYEAGIEGAEKLLALKERPTAIFAASDEMAVGVIHGIQDAGLSVPEDIEVVGFNNTRLSTMVRPTLTTIVQPTYDIGAVSMRLLTKFMNKEEVEEKKVILPHRIIERNSTKPQTGR